MAEQSKPKSASETATPDPFLKDFFLVAAPPDEEPHLIGQRCSACGGYAFPKRVLCPHCLHGDTSKPALLPPRATLYSYCVVYVPPMGFSAPYGLGTVDFPEQRLRINAPIRSDDFDHLELGEEMQLVVERIRESSEGEPLLGYVFVPRRELAKGPAASRGGKP
ncbi:MAG: OB-fold domain-containing protein [Chloroflexi bacterium]|nr:OB-fold domain-containing protein [Chloroflexota bacterium]